MQDPVAIGGRYTAHDDEIFDKIEDLSPEVVTKAAQQFVKPIKSPLKLGLEDIYANKSYFTGEGEGGNPRTSEFSFHKSQKSGRSVKSYKSQEKSEIDTQLAKI